MTRLQVLIVLGFLFIPWCVLAQNSEKQNAEVPDISLLRASESYLYLDTIEEK